MARCRVLSLSLALSLAVLTAGCGGDDKSDQGKDAQAAPGFPVSVSNCGVSTTYRRPPKRAVTLNQHATEILLALKLDGSMAGTAYLDDKVLPEYAAAYGKVNVLAKEYPSYEKLLTAEPDFVYGGFSSAFEEKEGRSRAVIGKAGIDTYLSIENCPSGPVTMTEVEAEVATIGKIFGAGEAAQRQITAMRSVLDGVKGKVGGVTPVRTFVYDSGDKTAFTAGGAGIGNEMIKLAGGVNSFADLNKRFGDVSFEQVAERRPEVILIYDYGDQPLEAKKKFLLGNPALKDVPAIRNRRFAVLPLSSTVMGVRVPAAVDALARQLHAARFG